MEELLANHHDGFDHPATLLLLRFVHWKTRRLDSFYELAHSGTLLRRRRREALLAMLHLSMESAVEAEQLRWVSAGRLADEALELSERFYGPDFSGGRFAVTLNAYFLYERDQVDAADKQLHDRLVLGGSQGSIEGALIAYIVSARIAAARSQVPFAVLLLHEAELLGEDRQWPDLVAASLAERVRIFVEAGRLVEAEGCARRLATMSETSFGRTNDRRVARCVAIGRARLELATDGAPQMAATLRLLLAEAVEGRESHVIVELQLLLACTLRRLEKEDEAAELAVRAIEIGARAGLYRTFADGGKALRGLLAWLYDRRVAPPSDLGEMRPYVRSLLAGSPQQTDRACAARCKHRSGESLSPRERHIVTLMSDGLSNKRIARQLGIAPETVKTHAKHIMLKLASQTRVEAVSRALRLGLI
jgi:DNA-binding CsgD family transcriptional regulator